MPVPVPVDDRPATDLDHLPGTRTDTALYLYDDLPYDDWYDATLRLMRIGGSIQFQIGDALNYGERNYGETFSQVLSEVVGLELKTLQNYKYVADRIDPIRRLPPPISFRHHHAVASLAPEMQDDLLSRARDGGWDSDQLRAVVRMVKAGEPIPDEPPDTVSNAAAATLRLAAMLGDVYATLEIALRSSPGEMFRQVQLALMMVDQLKRELDAGGAA